MQLRPIITGLVGLWILTSAPSAAPAGQPVNGLNLALEHLESGWYGRLFRAHGTAYRVRGIADLEPAANARIRARIGGEWTEVSTDSQGGFDLKIAVPTFETIEWYDEGEASLELKIEAGKFQREWAFPVTLHSPLRVIARTDRNQYEPGEPIHFWSRVEDAATGRPLPGVRLRIDIGDKTETVVTEESGTASVDFTATQGEADTQRTVSVIPENGRAATVRYTVAKRAVTDLLVEAVAEPKTARPGEPVTLTVSVRTVRGTPARGAAVAITVSEQQQKAFTDENGSVQFSLKAPEFFSERQPGRSRWVKFEGSAHKSGVRPADFTGGFHVRPPASLEIDLSLPRGGLVPETDEQLIVSVHRSDGTLPPPGTRVRVTGPATGGKPSTGQTDRHGLVSIPVRIGRDDHALHAAGDCDGSPATTVTITVDTPEATAGGHVIRRCVPVLSDARVAPLIPRPTAAPGAPFEVRIARRPDAVGRPVRVSLSCGGGAGPVSVKTVPPKRRSVRLIAPEDFLGICTVTARPVQDIRRGPTLGVGATEPLLVRPKRPTFPVLAFDREEYPIKGTARLTVQTPPGAPKSWAAVLVRDLAQHQGEKPFEEYFLSAALKKAVLDPDADASDLLLRAALTQYSSLDVNRYDDEETAPGPEMEMDAAREAVSFRTEKTGRWMTAVERLLLSAMKAGTVSDITVEKGGRRAFRPDILGEAVSQDETYDFDDDEDYPQTLGQTDVTVGMLTAEDPSFSFDAAAKRVARVRLVHLLAVLATDLNPEANDESRPLGRASTPPERRLSELVRRGVLQPKDLIDPWGNPFVLKNTGRTPRFVFSEHTATVELLSPGPDGRAGTPDDIRDPWARVIPEGTLYAKASGEDRLMALLSAVSPGEAVLDTLLAAYDRLNDEAVEELIGDALGLMGTGGGGGGGAGYGRGAGGLGGRRGRAPKIRNGSAMVLGKALAGMLREEFPATLFFTPDAPISPSGLTELKIPTAHAATTYLVETILWRADGWRWSASSTFRVNQDLLIDAPLPTIAAVGDEIRLPVRLSNRTGTPRTIRVTMTGSDGLGISPAAVEGVSVPARDTAELPIRVVLPKEGEGTVVLAAFDSDGAPLDAVRRPIAVKPSRRRAEASTQKVFRGSDTLALTVPDGASPAGEGSITLYQGAAIFPAPASRLWQRWLRTLSGNPELLSDAVPPIDALSELNETDPQQLALFIGAEWTAPRVRDTLFARAIEILLDHMENAPDVSPAHVEKQCRLLLSIAPAHLESGERPRVEEQLKKLVGTLRIRIEQDAAMFANAPWLHARAAAALMLTASKKDSADRAQEFLSRARDAAVPVGDDLWLEGGPSDVRTDERFSAGVQLALAELRTGNDEAAYILLRTVARFFHVDAPDAEERGYIDDEALAVAAAAAEWLGARSDGGKTTVTVDGVKHGVALQSGEGSVSTTTLGNGGPHTVKIAAPSGALVAASATARFTAPWSAPPPHVGPFFTHLEGDAGRAMARSGLRLVIRNRLPLAVSRPVVKITLPAGVEVDDTARRALAAYTVESPAVYGNTLTLKLRPMPPREKRSVPLPWLWTLSGQLTGLGVESLAADRPEAVTVTPAQKTTVAVPADATGGAQ